MPFKWFLFLTGYELWHQIWPKVEIACHVPPIAQMMIPAKVLDHSIPGASWTTNSVMTLALPCQNAGQPTVRGRLAAYCARFQLHFQTAHGPTFHRILFNKFYSVHSSHAGFHAKVVTCLWQQMADHVSKQFFGMSHHYC